MKSTLIFLILFCVATISYPQTTVWTGDPFENTTGISFSEGARTHLLTGGTITTRPQTKMVILFPPKFVEEYKEIRFTDGKIQISPKTSLPKFSWFFFIFCMVLPFAAILLVGIRLPQDQEKLLTLFYLTFSMGVIILVCSGLYLKFTLDLSFFCFLFTGMFSAVICALSLTKKLGGLMTSILGTVFFVFSLLVLIISSGDIQAVPQSSEWLLFLQYMLLILLASLVTWTTRLFLLKQEKQEPLQNLN